MGDSSHANTLRRASSRYPDLRWHTVRNSNSDDLLYLLNEGSIDYTVVNSNQFALTQNYYPYARVAFDLGRRVYLSWAFSRLPDSSLKEAADRFLWNQKYGGGLDGLVKRYLAEKPSLGFVDKRDFWRHVEERLPRYERHFRKAAEEIGIDWRLLAAIGYQESHWDPDAVSPTGVRGIMMLTQAAAQQLGVADRNDPEQSIRGGARYIKWKEKKIPARITGDDRLWLTLASYNVGFGHLEDARILTQRMGGDPDLWRDVKRHLPLLSKEEYYSQLKNGYARGREPVLYVENIRQYYRLLVWHSNQQKILTARSSVPTS